MKGTFMSPSLILALLFKPNLLTKFLAAGVNEAAVPTAHSVAVWKEAKF